jgi:hypothetical protein
MFQRIYENTKNIQLKWVIPARLNFDQGKKDEIQHHSWKERLRMSKIAKFGCEML